MPEKIQLLDQKIGVLGFSVVVAWASVPCALGNKEMQLGKLFWSLFRPACKTLLKRERMTFNLDVNWELTWKVRKFTASTWWYCRWDLESSWKAGSAFLCRNRWWRHRCGHSQGSLSRNFRNCMFFFAWWDPSRCGKVRPAMLPFSQLKMLTGSVSAGSLTLWPKEMPLQMNLVWLKSEQRCWRQPGKPGSQGSWAEPSLCRCERAAGSVPRMEWRQRSVVTADSGPGCRLAPWDYTAAVKSANLMILGGSSWRSHLCFVWFNLFQTSELLPRRVFGYSGWFSLFLIHICFPTLTLAC